jgi:hypothetical protein
MATSSSVDQELNRTEEVLAAQFYSNMYLYFSFAQSLKAQGAPRPAPRGAAPHGAGVLRPTPPRMNEWEQDVAQFVVSDKSLDTVREQLIQLMTKYNKLG